MNENAIAICLYIGILLMAGTVLVLTIVYFVRPASTRTSASKSSVGEATKEKKPFQIRVKRIRLGKKKSSDMEIKQPETKDMSDAQNKTSTKHAEVIPVNEDKKTENRAVTPVKQSVEVHPVDNDKLPNVVLAAKQEKEVNPKVVSPPVGPKIESKMPETPKPTPKSEIVVSLQSSPKPVSDVVKPNPKSDNNSSNGKNTSEKAVNIEAVKKESAPTMDNNNVKKPTNAISEKPKATPDVAKSAAPVTPAQGGKKLPEQKNSLDDLSKMFSKDVVEDNQATKLAKDMKDVEIGSLVKDGRDIVNILKRNRS